MMRNRNGLWRCFSRTLKRPSFIPLTHQNYNFEQHPEYTSKYERALRQKELLVKKLEGHSNEQRKRKRIVKDINYSVENYQVWRRFDVELSLMSQPNIFDPRILGSFKAKPRDLIRAFGFPNQCTWELADSISVFFFEDRNLDQYIIYDNTKGLESMLSKEPYEEILARFLQSTDEVEFRFSGHEYSEFKRFERYIANRLNNVISGKELSFHEIAESRIRPIEMFEDYSKDYPMGKEPAVFKYKRAQFEKTDKTQTTFIEDSEFGNELPKPRNIKDDEGTRRI